MKKKSLAKKVIESLSAPPVDPGEKFFIVNDPNWGVERIQNIIDRIVLKTKNRCSKKQKEKKIATLEEFKTILSGIAKKYGQAL